VVSVFYHKTSLKDTLIVNINNHAISHTDISDEYAIGFDENNKICFINIFNVSKSLHIPEGYLKLDNNIIKCVCDITKINLHEYADSISFIVGIVDTCKLIKNSHLHLCQVNVGNAIVQIVCGADNIEVSLKVVVAQVGTVMPNGLIIKSNKLLGYESNGMICSSRELNLLDSKHNKDGIIKLSDTYQIGCEFKEVYKNLR
jgi:tRNA-binding protein